MSTNNSPALSPSNSSTNASLELTPSKKVQALLAQFSDSDSDGGQTRQQVVVSKKSQPSITTAEQDSFSEDEDEAEQLKPRGRLAARLLGARPASNPSKDADTNEHIASITTATQNQELPENDEHLEQGATSLAGTSRSQSPLFFPSPSNLNRPGASPWSSPRRTTPTRSPSKSTNDGRSKFLALVEKHRRERIAREAAEIARRAAGVVDDGTPKSRRARGSSPADDSDESDVSKDEEAVKRIQKQARPTRKASKKALEEMNRETQRMNRNMQLAHQATTKKKITKESFLSRFGSRDIVLPTPHEPIQRENNTASSSATTSDVEEQSSHLETPPTSPIHEEVDQIHKVTELQVKDITNHLSTGQVTVEMRGGLALEVEIPAFVKPANKHSLSKKDQKRHSYYEQDATVRSPKKDPVASLADITSHINTTIPTLSHARPFRVNLARTFVTGVTGSDSEGEIEIVKDRGSKRKYAAFETLPKRKAKEMPSHLALRSLAHIVGNDDKKRSMNAAELQASLRRKARFQALEERKEKIEMLKAKGIVVQTAEERERDQQEVEDLVERARQEAAEIQKREKELAKKDGTYTRDTLDDEDDDSEDEDFEEEVEGLHSSESDDGEARRDSNDEENLIDDQVEEAASDEESETGQESAEGEHNSELEQGQITRLTSQPRFARNVRVISDDEEDDQVETEDVQTPRVPFPLKAPHSVPRSARKLIPGLQMSDDLPMDLSQAFAATMAESQTPEPFETPEQESLDLTADLPSPGLVPVPQLRRLDSIDLVSDSQPSASQTQPLNVNLLSQIQTVPESPRGLGIHGTQFTPSQRQVPFELTQDNGYVLSPFSGNRFAHTPVLNEPRSTVETVILPQGIDDSPVMQRRGKLQRGRAGVLDEDNEEVTAPITAFQVMHQAAKQRSTGQEFDKKKSNARNIVDEAAEESEDEYAGLGGASDDSGDDEENEADRQMIDEDTQIGKGDEAKLAGLYADRERERDEKEVSKLLKDITTGALRRKRGVGDDLDLSDEEDVAARRREAKRREFARMRRELLKDEAVGKIAEDKKKEAFLRSIEDREAAEDDEEADFDQSEMVDDSQTLDQSRSQQVHIAASQETPEVAEASNRALATTSDTKLNCQHPSSRRNNPVPHRKPTTLAQIRKSVSSLIEEPDSQAAMVDLGLSDSEDDPEAYVDLDRHLKTAEGNENDEEDDGEDLGDFVVDDELRNSRDSRDDLFKKPELPRQERAPYTERRTKYSEVVDRLSLLRQASSSSSSTSSMTSTSKMAFLSSKTGGAFVGVPTLLRRATTNSSLGSMSGRENVSATGVVTSKTERGNAGDEKEFVRKGNSGRRNAVNYQAERKTLREEKMSARAGIVKPGKGKKGHGFLGGLFRGNSWD